MHGEWPARAEWNDGAPSDAASKRRVVIIGGGMAGLAAAMAMTDDPKDRARLDVTVYQLGWRLGGKCASGRNQAMYNRSEEHGLHVWFGCYAASIAMLKRAYAERPHAHTWPATLTEGFTAQSNTPYMELRDGRWSVWPIAFPTMGLRMDEPVDTSLAGYLKRLAKFIWHVTIEGIPDNRRYRAPLPPEVTAVMPLDALGFDAAGGQAVFPYDEVLYRVAFATPGHDFDIPEQWVQALLSLLGPLSTWIGAFVDGAGASRLRTMLGPPGLDRAAILLDLAISVSAGILRDVVFSDWSAIDRFDAIEWLHRNGSRSSIDWAPVRALYDLFFAYTGGDTSQPSFSAASAIPAVLRILIDYPASVLYEMRSGMGEVVIAPLYEALLRRGVRFEFFHRLDELTPTADGAAIDTIRFGRQATVSVPAYTPLIDLPYPAGNPATTRVIKCWTSAPPYDQLAEGESLAPYDLEAISNQPPDAGSLTLQAGRDFDTLLLAIAYPELRRVSEKLQAVSPDWRRMVTALGTTATAGIQLWMTTDLPGLGWTRGPVAMDAAPEPLDVWADRTEILATESWPVPRPRSLQYLCGPFPNALFAGLAGSLERKAGDGVYSLARYWIENYASALWPAILSGGGVRWDLLYEPQPSLDPLRAQYLRANVDSVSLYVTSQPRSGAARLGAAGTGFRNLLIAGDWTSTKWNVGCVEAAVLSGNNAAVEVCASL